MRRAHHREPMGHWVTGGSPAAAGGSTAGVFGDRGLSWLLLSWSCQRCSNLSEISVAAAPPAPSATPSAAGWGRGAPTARASNWKSTLAFSLEVVVCEAGLRLMTLLLVGHTDTPGAAFGASAHQPPRQASSPLAGPRIGPRPARFVHRALLSCRRALLMVCALPPAARRRLSYERLTLNETAWKGFPQKGAPLPGSSVTGPSCTLICSWAVHARQTRSNVCPRR